MRRTFNDVATLAARLGVGGIFFANGWHKLEAGLNATTRQFAEQGAPVPNVWAAFTMLIELLGGALLIAGFAVPICGILLFIEALAVFAVASGDQGQPLTGGDTNLIVALGAASILLSVVGAGRISVDHMVVIKRREDEEAGDRAADDEANAVIAALREPRPGSGDPGPGKTAPKGPVTFPRGGSASGEPGDPADAGDTVENPARGRKPRQRRTDPGPDTTSTSRSEAPTVGKGDKLVAGRRDTGAE